MVACQVVRAYIKESPDSQLSSKLIMITWQQTTTYLQHDVYKYSHGCQPCTANMTATDANLAGCYDTADSMPHLESPGIKPSELYDTCYSWTLQQVLLN